MAKFVSNAIDFFQKNPYGIYVLVAIIMVSIPIIQFIIYTQTYFEKTITVKEKYTRYRRKSSNYNIVDTEGTIYQIDNLWFKFDFNRANDYAQMEVGKTYNVKGYGFRSGIIDSYLKIFEHEEV